MAKGMTSCRPPESEISNENSGVEYHKSKSSDRSGGKRMSKYNSTYFNSERYYDPTAGAALLSVIRSEKKRYDLVMHDIPDRDKRKDTEFAHIFADYYNRSRGLRSNGKKKRFADYAIVYGHIRIYQYCMNHVNDNDFSIDDAVKRMNLGSDKKVQQVFNGRGMMGKLIRCYKDWKQTGHFQWEQEGE